MKTLIRCHILWHLIWVYTVSCSPGPFVEILRANMTLSSQKLYKTKHTSVIKVMEAFFIIATEKALFSSEKCWYLSYFSMKTYVVGTHYKHLAEALLMSTHNVCFCGEIRKILCGYSLLSVAMFYYFFFTVLIPDQEFDKSWIFGKRNDGKESMEHIKV